MEGSRSLSGWPTTSTTIRESNVVPEVFRFLVPAAEPRIPPAGSESLALPRGTALKTDQVIFTRSPAQGKSFPLLTHPPQRAGVSPLRAPRPPPPPPSTERGLDSNVPVHVHGLPREIYHSRINWLLVASMASQSSPTPYLEQTVP